MSEYTTRSSRRQDAYVPSSYSDSGSKREHYDRESPYDSLYRRSFEPVPDDQSSRSAAGRSHHSHGHHDDDDDSYDYKSQGQISRLRDEYPDSSSGRSRGQSRGQSRGGRYSQTGYDSTEGSPIGREGDGSEEGKRRLSGAVGKEKKDIAATLIGAAAGAFLGHESTQGKGFGTLGGALLGGLSANAIEHRHLKHEEAKDGDRQSHRSSRHEDY